jgi:chemotaxis protein CheZ
MRQEIAALGVNELKDARLPGAGQELDEIVRATENATNSIMACAEELLAADASDPAFADNVQDVATRIFEACAFQDLTGQRIAKVVETLRVIESRVARFASAVRLPDEAPVTGDEAARAACRRDLILNGPQAKGVAIEQDAIDALLGAETDQSAIDALFD